MPLIVFLIKNVQKLYKMTSQCAFGGRRVAILGSDGRIVIREKDVLDDIALFQPCGATSIAMNGTCLWCLDQILIPF